MKCYESCLTCTSGGNELENNCTKCDTDNEYYPIRDISNQCVKSKDGYYLNKDASTKSGWIFKHCNEACYSCYGYGIDENTECIQCTRNPTDGRLK